MRKITIYISSIIVAAFLFVIGVTCEVKAELLSPENPAAVQYYSMLPANVIDSLNRRNCNILVNTDALCAGWVKCGNTSYDISQVAGLYYAETNEARALLNQAIYIRNGHEESIIHEVGHSLEDYNNIFEYWTNTPAWNSIYVAEAGAATAIGISYSPDKSEYFAEGFRMYVFNPSALLSTCPLTYQFIQAVVALQ